MNDLGYETKKRENPHSTVGPMVLTVEEFDHPGERNPEKDCWHWPMFQHP